MSEMVIYVFLPSESNDDPPPPPKKKKKINEPPKIASPESTDTESSKSNEPRWELYSTTSQLIKMASNTNVSAQCVILTLFLMF